MSTPALVGAMVLMSAAVNPNSPASAGALATLDVPQPATFATEEMGLERDAELLTSGSWPDKNLTISEADLDSIVARFSADTIPIKVEHVDSPLDPLGLVKSIRREGNKLLGKLAFPADLGGFLQRRGIAKLSVGLERSPLSLAEVSLVLKPRVASAAMLSEGTGAGGVGDTDRAELAALRSETRALWVDAQISELKRSGKVIPAVEALARVLLSAESSALVTLSDGTSAGVAATALKLLQALPPLVKFAETAGGTMAGGQEIEASAPITAEQQDWLRRALGVNPEHVAQEIAATAQAGQGGPSYRTTGGGA